MGRNQGTLKNRKASPGRLPKPPVERLGLFVPVHSARPERYSLEQAIHRTVGGKEGK